MELIYSRKEPWMLLHIVHRMYDFDNERFDLVPRDHLIQSAALRLPFGKTFKPHKHFPKDRPQFKYPTQESWIVIRGRVRCTFYDIDDTIIAEPVLEAGDCSITLNGGHTYKILEDDSRVYELKTGPYSGQENDKTFI